MHKLSLLYLNDLALGELFKTTFGLFVNLGAMNVARNTRMGDNYLDPRGHLRLDPLRRTPNTICYQEQT